MQPMLMTLSWQHMTYKPSKLDQTELVSGLWSEFINKSVQCVPSMHGYKTLRTAVIICAALVNTHTHRQTDYSS